MAAKFDTVAQYLDSLSPVARASVDELRSVIARLLPDATEVISYEIPTFKLGKASVVHVAGWGEHASMYPVPEGDADFQRDVAPYRHGKGTVRFAYGTPLPIELIERHVRFLLAERH